MSAINTVVVSEALANKPGSGGAAWVPLSWTRGFRKLGLDAWFIEELHSTSDDASVDEAVAYFRDITSRFGLGDRAALVVGGEIAVGPAFGDLEEVADSSALVNIGGHLQVPRLWGRFRTRVMVDLDPGFTQFWHAQGTEGDRVVGHDLYFTVGENIGRPSCSIPTSGINWLPIRQPVLFEDWPLVPVEHPNRFTTVANWRGPFGPVEFGGVRYGLKAHEFRKFVDLPRHATATVPQDTPIEFEIALRIHEADQADLQSLSMHGWQITPPEVVMTPDDFRSFVQGSAAEFSVAQGIYVDTHSGWFSDRTVRYLASGRPALVQDTGFSDNIPVGLGLLTFSTVDEASDGAGRIVTDYADHAAGARRLAEQYFDAVAVLAPLWERISLASRL